MPHPRLVLQLLGVLVGRCKKRGAPLRRSASGVDVDVMLFRMWVQKRVRAR